MRTAGALRGGAGDSSIRLPLHALLVATTAVTFAVWLVAPPLAFAEPRCQTNYSYDASTGTCEPIWSRPTGDCDPYTSGGFLGCLGGNWEGESGAPPRRATAPPEGNLTPYEQKYVADLAVYGLRPTRTVREFVDIGWGVCRMLETKSNDEIIEELFQQGHLTRQQLQVIINIAQNRLCPPRY